MIPARAICVPSYGIAHVCACFASIFTSQARRRHRAVLEAAISKSLNHPNVVATYETEVIPLSVPGTARNLSALPDPLAAGGDPAGNASEAVVLDATTDTYKLLLVMEYCDAGSLTRALGKWPGV